MKTYYPWGTTGRVTLHGEAGPGVARHIYIGGVLAGWVGYPGGYPGQQDSDWWATVYYKRGYQRVKDLPTLDAAVMWVLRRAAAEVWREERGPVWQVMACPSPSLGPGWDAWLPGGSEFGHYATYAAAIKAATP